MGFSNRSENKTSKNNKIFSFYKKRVYIQSDKYNPGIRNIFFISKRHFKKKASVSESYRKRDKFILNLTSKY